MKQSEALELLIYLANDAAMVPNLDDPKSVAEAAREKEAFDIVTELLRDSRALDI